MPSARSRTLGLARLAPVVAVLAIGCGARSQLIAPDTGLDARDVTDASDGADRVDAVDRAMPVDGNFQPPVDDRCPGTCPFANVTPVFPPFTRLAPQGVPTDCSNGFELGGVRAGCGAVYRLIARRPGGARAITLDVDYATYLVPDAVSVTGLDASGARYSLLQTCRMQTSVVGGPSDRRPPDDTIRQFRIDVREGTRELDIDFGAVTSPMYIRVRGLCDFTVSRYPDAPWWRAVL